MDIGKEKRKITVIPHKAPIHAPEEPKRPMPAPSAPEPVKPEPEKVPA